MVYETTDELLEHLRELGELEDLRGADWNLEVGAITDLYEHTPRSPALLFDEIKDYPPGFRVLANVLGSPRRLGLVLGLDPGLTRREFVASWRALVRDVSPVAPRVVDHAPFLANVRCGRDVDLLEFPVPWWHEHDGGRFIGTGCVFITRDPDTGEVNLGTYRNQVLERNAVGVLFSDESRRSAVHFRKYRERNQPCPVSICFGGDPLLFMFASLATPAELEDYDYIGGFRGRPVDVVPSDVTGLPVPASAEIVADGTITPGDTFPEGPFGEWTGYYGGEVSPRPVMRVERISFRDRPILLGVPPTRPPSNHTYYRGIQKAANIWNDLEAAGVPGVQGVWCHEAGGNRLFNVIAIRQLYPGHAFQAGMVASQCGEGVRLGRYVVVVDEDIDPTDLGQVIWAMSTRSDPVRSIHLMERTLGGALNPASPPSERQFTSRAIIDATWPFEWRGDSPPVVGVGPELARRTLEKWGHLLERRGLLSR